MARYQVKTFFTLSDGRELECWYEYTHTSGYTSGLPEHCYPDETDVDEPEYYIDGEPVEVSQLPRGLDVIATKLYEAGDGEYGYRETRLHDDMPDFDDSSWDY